MADLAIQNPAPPLPEKAAGRVVEMLRVPAITLHAFCETPEIMAAMQTAGADRRMSRTHASVQPGGLAAALKLYRKNATPDLVLFESHAGAGELFVQLDRRVWLAKNEHLHLVELMDAKDSLRVTPGCARFAPKTRRIARIAKRQLPHRKRLAEV